MPEFVDHKVFLLAEPAIDWSELERYFEEMDYSFDWIDRVNPAGFAANDEESYSDSEVITEFAGRRCYKSFGIGDNPNVTRVREDSEAWYDNLLMIKHGSVLEHGMFTFALENVSRVETHEHVRHRVGTAISQESMRFVRLTDIPFWMPEWAKGDPVLVERCKGVLEVLENHQRWMTQYFGIEPDPNGIVEVGKPYVTGHPDDQVMGFAQKKFLTSFMRRFAPEGVATGMVWSANARQLRQAIEIRTSEGAEEEIRHVFGMIAKIVTERFPLAFGDFTEQEDGSWTTPHSKV